MLHSTHSLLNNQGAIASLPLPDTASGEPRAPVSKGLAIPTTQRTGRFPDDSRPCPPLCTILCSLPTPIHTLPTSDSTFGFCSHAGSGTAEPCSHGDRCFPSTRLDLDLGGNGQASLTRVDGQLQRMRRRHQLHPFPVSICRTVATSLSRQGRARAPQIVVTSHPSVPLLSG